MLILPKGDPFSSDAEALLNAVNAAGVVKAKELRFSLKKPFPENFNAYRKVCRKKN